MPSIRLGAAAPHGAWWRAGCASARSRKNFGIPAWLQSTSNPAAGADLGTGPAPTPSRRRCTREGGPSLAAHVDSDHTRRASAQFRKMGAAGPAAGDTGIAPLVARENWLVANLRRSFRFPKCPRFRHVRSRRGECGTDLLRCLDVRPGGGSQRGRESQAPMRFPPRRR